METETPPLNYEEDIMKEFILVITMWGIDAGGDNNYIGQIALQQPMTKPQCEYMMNEKMWKPTYENEYFYMKVHCFPAECSGKEQCTE